MVSKEQILLSQKIGSITDYDADAIVSSLSNNPYLKEVLIDASTSTIKVYNSKDFKIENGLIKLKRKYGKFNRNPIVRITTI